MHEASAVPGDARLVALRRRRRTGGHTAVLGVVRRSAAGSGQAAADDVRKSPQRPASCVAVQGLPASGVAIG